MRHRKHQVDIRDAQEFSLQSIRPLLTFDRLTNRTLTVATALVDGYLLPAALAGVNDSP